MAKRVAYREGQWFAVPLGEQGFGLGILVRGGPRAQGGLGYFFGPRRDQLPNTEETLRLHANDAVFIAWFGGRAIADGRWPLIASPREFLRSEWPVPRFKRIDSLVPSKGWLVDYDQQASRFGQVIHEEVRNAEELGSFPNDRVYGDVALAEELARRLSDM